MNKVMMKGFTQEDFETVIKNYENLNVLMVSNGEIELIEWFNDDCYFWEIEKKIIWKKCKNFYSINIIGRLK